MVCGATLQVSAHYCRFRSKYGINCCPMLPSSVPILAGTNAFAYFSISSLSSSIFSPFLFVVVVVGESFAELRGGVKQLFHAFLFFYWYARLLLAAQERCIRGSKLILKLVEGRGGGKVCD